MSDDAYFTVGGPYPEAMKVADHWEALARESGVFVRREGTTVYVNGPINLPSPERTNDAQ